MPVTKTAKKALRQSARKAAVNKPRRTAARTNVATALETPTLATVSSAFSSLDRAVKNKLFHWRKAARMKSRLSKLLGK